MGSIGTIDREPATRMSRAVSWTVRLVGAALLLAMAWIHLDLWLDGFRDTDLIGPLFLANVVLGGLGALAVLLAPPRLLPWASLLGGLLEIGTLAGLVLALTVGLFGYHEAFGGYVLPTIIVESAGFLVLFGFGALELLRARQRDRRR